MTTYRTPPGVPTRYAGNRFRLSLVESAAGEAGEDRVLSTDDIHDPQQGTRILLGPTRQSPGNYMRPLTLRVERLASGPVVPGRITVTVRFQRRT